MLISSGLQQRVWVFMQAADMRNGIDGLYGIVKRFHSNPLNGDLFLFLSKDRKTTKALFWDGTGFSILMKRIEQGRFADIFTRGSMSLSELSLFIEGASCVKRNLSPKDRTDQYLS